MSEIRQGLLVNYKYCDGCHACETACKVEGGLEPGHYGIQVVKIGPWEIARGKWQYDFVPVPTDECNLCASRVAEGKLPTCVHHCQSMCIEWGPVDELAKKAAAESKCVLFSR